MSLIVKPLAPVTQELLDALKDIALDADMMLQPIPLLSANKPLVHYATEVKRMALAAIARVEPVAPRAPHSWETEEYEPEDFTSPEQAAADDAGVPLQGPI